MGSKHAPTRQSLAPHFVLAFLLGVVALATIRSGWQQQQQVGAPSILSSRTFGLDGTLNVRRPLYARSGLGNLFGGSAATNQYPIMGDEEIMSQKEHGTTTKPVQMALRYGCDRNTADRICCFNRHYAEHSGYFRTTKWMNEVDRTTETTYFDSVTGKPLFVAPRGRSFEDFLRESEVHGWPSFRDEEVVWDNVRVLRDGETVSVDGTHLGHNLPDVKGNRYCINLVSVAGNPTV